MSISTRVDDLQLAVQGLDVAIWSYDLESKLAYFSSSWRRLLGCTETDNSECFDRWYARIHPEDRAEVVSTVAAQLRGDAGDRFEFEHRVMGADDTYRWLLVRGVTLRDVRRKALRVVAAAIDLTQLKTLAGALHESDARFRTVADSAPVLIWIAGLDRKCTWFNRQWLEFTGRSLEEETCDGWTQGIHPDDLPLCLKTHAKSSEQREPFEIEYRLLHRSGEYRWLLDRGMPRYDSKKQFAGYVGSCTDITEHKATLSRLSERTQLLRQLITINERDRYILACEIHDGLLQDIIGAEMLLQSCGTLSHEQFAVNLETARETLKLAIGQGRRLIGELRPLILDEQGFVSGIEYLIAEIANRMSAKIELINHLDRDYRSAIWAGNLFRIVQESLTNVERHSGATHAAVELSRFDDTICIQVRDNGIGFDPHLVPSERFGLRSIRERSSLFGGKATIDSSEGTGTWITVEVPLPVDQQSEA